MSNSKLSIRPGRKTPVSRWTLGFIVFLVLLVIGVFLYSLHMAASSRIMVFALDPYITLKIEGADGYGMIVPEMDKAKLEEDFEKYLRENSLIQDEQTIDEIVSTISSSVSYDVEVEAGSAQEVEAVPAQEEGEQASETDPGEELLPRPGVSNGDLVTLQVSIDKGLQDRLMEEGLAIAFNFEPVTQEVRGLPDAEPYDLFADLSVTFEGYDGTGEASIVYSGYYPFTFSAEPLSGLRNGQELTVRAELTEGYDLDRIVEEYSIMPARLEQTYTVTGLWVKPVSIQDFTEETVSWLLLKGREQVSALLEDEYEENERIDALEDSNLYFCTVKNAGADENADNRLYCTYLVHYMNTNGDELEYYYYVRFDNLVLDDSGSVLTDPVASDHPLKPAVPLGELFGDGAEVSVPGILNFRTLAGYETKEQLHEKVITPLEETYEITSLEF